jgi:hypothetical protein
MALFAFTAALTFASTSIIVRWVPAAGCCAAPLWRRCAQAPHCRSRSLHAPGPPCCSYSAQFRVHSYGDLVRMHFGRRGAAVLQLSIIAHVFGVMVG